MRPAQKEALVTLKQRASLDNFQLKELSMLLASTHGPLVIGSLIENGLKEFRKKRGKNAKRKSHDWEGL